MTAAQRRRIVAGLLILLVFSATVLAAARVNATTLPAPIPTTVVLHEVPRPDGGVNLCDDGVDVQQACILAEPAVATRPTLPAEALR